MTDSPCRNDAAHLLGVLTGAEQVAYERHLAGCAGCRAAITDLSGVPGALRRVPTDLALSMLSDRAQHATDREDRAPNATQRSEPGTSGRC